MRLMVPVIVALFTAPLSAQSQPTGPSPLDASISHGLTFLTTDALAWKSNHDCASCHHAVLVVWSMQEAKRHGYAVDEPVLADLTQWIAQSGTGKFAMTRPAAAPLAASPKAIWFAFALSLDPGPSALVQRGQDLLLQTVKSEQTEPGYWSAWPQTRPPIFGGSDQSLTTLAIFALLPQASAGDPSAIRARDKAIQWLSTTSPEDDPQTIALRLILWKKVNRPAAECQPLIENIKRHQNPDGGWSQTKEMPSDAWATGQALYALSRASLPSDDPALTRAQSFLLKTQLPNGSWPMTSRPIATATPPDHGSTSLIPITAAGTAWAVLGLTQSHP